MKFSIFSILIFLIFTYSSCTRNDYDGKFYKLVDNAKNGDYNSALDAYTHCSAFLKLDPSILPITYLGKCGALLATIRDLALDSGDPAKIKFVYDVISNEMRLSEQYIKNQYYLPEHYLEIARIIISRSCKERISDGCYDKEIMDYFGLKVLEKN